MPSYNSEHIIQYLTGELPQAEREGFEAEVARDPRLAAETDRYREMLKVLRERLPDDAVADGLEATLVGMREKYFGESDRGIVELPGKKRSVIIPVRTVQLVCGVAAIVIVVVSGIWLVGGGRPTLEQLGQTEMVTSVQRGEQSDTVMELAAERFNAGRFEQALPLLNEAVKADSSNQLARFYLGVTLWQLKRLAAARADLEAVYAGGSALQFEAAFYLALTYAQEKDTPSAIHWLSRIPDDAPITPKAKKLKQLLEAAR